MMVVVPSLAHGDQAAIANVVALHAGALDVPRARPLVMGKVTDQPMSGDRGGDPRGYAPDQPGQAADGKEQHRPGQLLRHPGPLEKAVEPIKGDATLDLQLGRM